MDPLQVAAQNGLTKFSEAWYKYNNIDTKARGFDPQQYSTRILGEYNMYRNAGKGPSLGSDTKGSFIGTVTSLAQGTLESQIQKGYMPGASEEIITIQEGMSILINQQGKLNEITDIGQKLLEGAAKQVGLYYQQQTELLGQVNKEMGLTGAFSEDYRQTLTTANQELLKYGITFGELSSAATDLINTTGRFAVLNSDTWKEAGRVAGAYVGTLGQMAKFYPEFEKVGLGAADTNERVAKAGQLALNVGLQSKKATDDLKTNIGKLNEYGFKNGVDGLSQMVRKATEFRISMDSVFRIADKVMDPASAIDLTANLQALGGAIGDFNDPLKLMYMATNNVEGLQDALIGAAKNLATYNTEQGRFEITGVNLRRAREMAQQLGVDYGELAKGAIAAAERTSAASDLMARGLTLDKDQQEFITNIAQMKGGRMVISLNSEALQKEFNKSELALEELSDAQAASLIKMQDQFKKMSPEQIIENQATNVENIMRNVNFMAAVLREQAGKAGKAVVKRMEEEAGFSVGDAAGKVSKFADRNAPEIRQWGMKLEESIMNAGKVNQPKPDKSAEENLRKQNNANTPQSTPLPTPLPSTIKSHITISYTAMGQPVAEHKGSYLAPISGTDKVQ